MDEIGAFHQGGLSSDEETRGAKAKNGRRRRKQKKATSSSQGNTSHENNDANTGVENGSEQGGLFSMARKHSLFGSGRKIKKYRDRSAFVNDKESTAESKLGKFSDEEEEHDEDNEKEKESRRISTTGRKELLSTEIRTKQAEKTERRRQEALQNAEARVREQREEIHGQKRQQVALSPDKSPDDGQKKDQTISAHTDGIADAFSVAPAVPEHKRSISAASLMTTSPSEKKSKTDEDNAIPHVLKTREKSRSCSNELPDSSKDWLGRIPRWLKLAVPVVAVAAFVLIKTSKRK